MPGFVPQMCPTGAGFRRSGVMLGVTTEDGPGGCLRTRTPGPNPRASEGYDMSTPLPADRQQEAPRRIQRKRTKGWRMPEGAVYVGRPTVFGNPFRVIKSACCPTWDVVDDNGVTYLIDHKYTHEHDDVPLDTPRERRYAARQAVGLYADELLHWFGGRIEMEPVLREAIAALAGHDLACWCPLGQPCHADVLLELANGGAVR